MGWQWTTMERQHNNYISFVPDLATLEAPYSPSQVMSQSYMLSSELLHMPGHILHHLGHI